MLLPLLLSWVSAWAAPALCDQLRAEAEQLRARAAASACEESRTTHETYLRAFAETQSLCEKVQAEVSAGPARLKDGTSDQMHIEILDIKQRHAHERQEISDRIVRDLLPTPLDRTDLKPVPPVVSSDCGTEVEDHVRYRRTLLRGLADMFTKIDANDETLLQQALERATPEKRRTPAKLVR